MSVLPLLRVKRALCLAALLTTVIGCGGNGPIQIDARFAVDGEPLTNAAITFVRQDGQGGRASVGVTDSEGAAMLTTYKRNDGVMPGEYRVVVIKAPVASAAQARPPEPSSFEDMMKASAGVGAAAPPKARRRRSMLPEVYADPGTTPLTCTVTRSDREFTFEVSSSPE